MQMVELSGLQPLISLLTSASAGCQQHAAAAITKICGGYAGASAQVIILASVKAYTGLLASASVGCQALTQLSMSLSIERIGRRAISRILFDNVVDCTSAH